MEKEHCSNCGWELSAENIRLALEDAGAGISQEELTFCCPSYSDEEGCKGYAKADLDIPAYWRTN